MSTADEFAQAQRIRERVCLFVKSPRQGEVKTRLAAGIGAPNALAAYHRLVEHTITQLQAEPAVQRQLWVAGSLRNASVQAWSECWQAQPQRQVGEDLGERMFHALYQVDPKPGRDQSALVVGADCPSLDATVLREAFARLRAGAQVVIAPAEDGGYGLIGARWQAPPALIHSPFAQITWGSSLVFDQTLERCQVLGLSVSVLPTVWDVDEETDWQRFLAEYGS